ncbi:hypothetical protein [Paractinoplanes globisporus]|uniref:Integral membrane protein n=1 Tax=Paractinoplanes globisporus TaxID=113565 RepID=A0ABW6WL57_9ACTN|nr:hypothetical protein [Actinoplanes globisporus]
MSGEKGEKSVVDNPATLLWAVRLLYVQCVGLAALAIWMIILTVTSDVPEIPVALALIVLTIAGAVAVFFVARSLGRRSLHARGPAIVVQLFVIAAGGFLIQVHPVWLGVVLMAFGVIVGVLTVLPPTTRALGVD